MQRLGGLDAAFFLFETSTMHMHVGGLMLIDFSAAKEPYSFDRIKEIFGMTAEIEGGRAAMGSSRYSFRSSSLRGTEAQK